MKTSKPARQQTWLICPDRQFAVCQQAVAQGKAGPDGKRLQLTVYNSEQECLVLPKNVKKAPIILK